MLNFDQRNTLLAYLGALIITAIIGVWTASFLACAPILFLSRLFTNRLFALRNRSTLSQESMFHFNNGRVVSAFSYNSYVRLIQFLTPLLLLGVLGATFVFAESGCFGFLIFALVFSYATFLNGYLIVKNLPLITRTFVHVNTPPSAMDLFGSNAILMKDDLSAHMRHSPGFSHLPSNIHHSFHQPR